MPVAAGGARCPQRRWLRRRSYSIGSARRSAMSDAEAKSQSAISRRQNHSCRCLPCRIRPRERPKRLRRRTRPRSPRTLRWTLTPQSPFGLLDTASRRASSEPSSRSVSAWATRRSRSLPPRVPSWQSTASAAVSCGPTNTGRFWSKRFSESSRPGHRASARATIRLDLWLGRRPMLCGGAKTARCESIWPAMPN